MPRNNVMRRCTLVLLPMVLLTSCVSKSPCLSPMFEVPALPPEARQPATPSICLPTCSAGLMKRRESWQRSLTIGASPASSVNVTTTR
ncbi:hypothetical protein GEM_4070 [Burkholderia cepacia GG4]|uniref:Uncharacterized protein n=1 Tax=Burkholderia cepacia GG4 TaxID=1009846 RepID=A0A9W3PBE0_BURCE|nr:hypothetical protein GEM_4070 [Burkholderia cepacia GG4]